MAERYVVVESTYVLYCWLLIDMTQPRPAVARVDSYEMAERIARLLNADEAERRGGNGAAE